MFKCGYNFYRANLIRIHIELITMRKMGVEMKFIMFILSVIIVPACYALEAGTIKNVTLVADQWCPYNCTPGDVNPGFLVEIADYSFSKEGYDVNYLVRPWTRSILEVRKGDYDGIIGAGRDEVPDFIFPEDPLYSIEHVFYVNSSSDWFYDGHKSLSNINLGAIKNYSYGSFLKDYIEPNYTNETLLTVLHGDDAFGRLPELLKRGRTDAFVEEANIVKNYLNGLDAYRDIKPAGVASTEGVYIAFSPNKRNAKLYAKILSKGFKELKNSGHLDELIDKYSLAKPNKSK